MNASRIVAAAAGPILLATIASFVEAAELQDLPLNAMVTDGFLQIGTHKYPLPPGEWRLIAKTDSTVTIDTFAPGGRILRGYLLNTKEKQFRAGMLIAASAASSRVGSWTTDPCKRDDVVFKDAFGGNFKFPECLIVNHYVNLLQPTKDWLNEAAQFVEVNQIVLPKTALAAVYDKFFYGDFVQVRFWINPELADQAPSKASTWTANDWHKDRVARDPAKSLYLDKFTVWAKQVPVAYGAVLEGAQSPTMLSDFPELRR
jgi:hypothetical protein